MTSGSEQIARERAARQSKGQAAPHVKAAKSLKWTIIGGLLSAYFSKESGMAKYSKFFGSIIGGLVGSGAAWLAAHSSLATCVADSCTVLGLSQEAITAALVMLIGGFGTWVAPKNQP